MTFKKRYAHTTNRRLVINDFQYRIKVGSLRNILVIPEDDSDRRGADRLSDSVINSTRSRGYKKNHLPKL